MPLRRMSLLPTLTWQKHLLSQPPLPTHLFLKPQLLTRMRLKYLLSKCPLAAHMFPKPLLPMRM